MTNRTQVQKQVFWLISVAFSGVSPLAVGSEATAADGPRYYEQVESGQSKLIECDVAVYGGTPAGVTAAIQAARKGKKAVLLSFDSFF